MIEVTRLNGTKVLVNPGLVVFIESTPDTVISFLDGRKIIVSEKVEEIQKMVLDYNKKIFA